MTIEAVDRQFTALRADRPDRFERMAEAVLAFQARCNPVYARYCKSKKHLPVDAFKRAVVATFPPEEAERVFESSGTGRTAPSRHYVRRLDVYERSVRTHFEAVFGRGPFTLLAHLPGYAGRGAASSLVHMAACLIEAYGDAHSGFFLQERGLLDRGVAHSRGEGTPLLLLGAAFGLLDLVEQGPVPLPETACVIETGGMKTYRREIGRERLHRELAAGFGLPESRIWSEYGMCELMSQCYTRGGAVFFPPPWMRFGIVDPEDSDRVLPEGTPGALALIDLANLYTASALLTEDRAVQRGGGFEVLGRLSRAELRGCNFLLEKESEPE